jgi:hypothetical protein
LIEGVARHLGPLADLGDREAIDLEHVKQQQPALIEPAAQELVEIIELTSRPGSLLEASLGVALGLELVIGISPKGSRDRTRNTAIT